METAVTRLLVMLGRRKAESFPLTRDNLRIGRSSDNDIIISHTSLSQQHALVTKTKHGWAIEDQGSLNGVTVNKRTITNPTLLRIGTHIMLGDIHIMALGDPEPYPVVNLDQHPDVPADHISTSLESARDLNTLKAIANELPAFDADLGKLNMEESVSERGYFLPDEDDRIRSLIVRYRNIRATLHDILNRNKQHHESAPDDEDTPIYFLLGFTAATMLYTYSSHLVNTYYDTRMIRHKLNEPDPRWGLHENFFDEIYKAVTSLRNQKKLIASAEAYEAAREELRASLSDSPFLWLLDEIEKRYNDVRKHPLRIWSDKAEWGVTRLAKKIKAPVKNAIYEFQSWIIDELGHIWFQKQPHIPATHQARFQNLLRPGDLIFMRPERKSSTYLCPGWWTHVALYHGDQKDMSTYDLEENSTLTPYLPAINTGHCIIEALGSGVVLSTMRDSLNVDHAMIVRPNLPPKDIHTALNAAFSHLGKPYDFDFDFSRTDKLVCTELIYRAYHGIENLSFEPELRLGRPTLSPDALLTIVFNGIKTDSYTIVAGSTRNHKIGKSKFLDPGAGARFIRKTLGLDKD